MLDFRVETFLCVCRHMNFTKASKELNITQPAVSHHIRYLEGYYGAPLFIYENKVLSLTTAGETLFRRLEALKNTENQLKGEILSLSAQVHTFSIGVTKTVGEYAIIRPLSEYMKRHPDINIHVHFGNTAELLEMMGRGEIELALIEGDYPKVYYDHMNYSNEKYVAVCSAEHEFANGIPHRLRELVPERLLIRETGSGTRNILVKNLEAKGISVSEFTHYMEVENMHTIIGLLEMDCGISFLYRIAAEKQIKDHILKEIELDDFRMEHEFDFIWEKGSIYTAKNIEFCKELIQYR